jgi:hypothetical protein
VDVEILQKSDGERALVESFAGSLDKKHRDGRKEVASTESLDETDEEADKGQDDSSQFKAEVQRENIGELGDSLDSTVTRHVDSRVGKRSEKFPQVDDQAFSASSRLLKSLDEWRNNLLESLIDNTQTVGVVPLENVGTHEGEDRHDVLDELIGNERTQLSEKEKRLVVGLRINRS